MMGSGPIADTSSVDGVLNLIAVLADPKATKAALSDLANAQKAADAALAAANAATAPLESREAAVASREAAVAATEISLADAVAKQKEYAASTNAELDQRSADLMAREIAASKGDNELNARVADVTGRERAIEAREAKAQAAQEAADAKASDADARVANLKSALGA